jgi:hypothetical protein
MRPLIVTAACVLLIPVGISIVAEYWPKRETEELQPPKRLELSESRGRDWARLPEAAGDWNSVFGKWSIINVDYVNELEMTFSDLLLKNAIEIELGPCWAVLRYTDDDGVARERMLPIRLHPHETPKAIELAGVDADEAAYGIYKVTKQDQLVIAIASDLEHNGADGIARWKRPERFDSNGTILILSKRIDKGEQSMRE